MELLDLHEFLSAPLGGPHSRIIAPALIIAILIVLFSRRDAVLPGLLLGALVMIALG